MAYMHQKKYENGFTNDNTSRMRGTKYTVSGQNNYYKNNPKNVINEDLHSSI